MYGDGCGECGLENCGEGGSGVGGSDEGISGEGGVGEGGGIVLDTLACDEDDCEGLRLYMRV